MSVETVNNNFEGNISDNPPSYENVINSASAQPSSLGYSNSLIGEVESYGRTLFSFRAEFPNELSLKENEIVHLIRHIDNEWIEGEIDGRVGIFPKSFVEIIVDCEVNQRTDDENNQNITICEEFPADSFARVLYDFDGELESDLKVFSEYLLIFVFGHMSQSSISFIYKVRKGDTLTLIRRIDTNWLEAMDDCGNVGFVPSNHCEIIDDISSNISRTISVTSDETAISEPVNHLYSSDLSSTEDKEVVNISEFDPINKPNDNLSVIDGNICNSSSKSPQISPKIPRRPAPSIPKTSKAIKCPQEVSPHRPPPPVPKHKSQRHRIKTNDFSDSVNTLSINFNRQESIRSSITSNSSSSSAKSDTASGVTTVPSAEELRRAEERKKKVRN
jgi:hypothetical protein